jgi:hypothetical protein
MGRRKASTPRCGQFRAAGAGKVASGTQTRTRTFSATDAARDVNGRALRKSAPRPSAPIARTGQGMAPLKLPQSHCMLQARPTAGAAHRDDEAGKFW